MANATNLLADTAAERLGESAAVLREIMDAPDKGIPSDLLSKARCLVVVPGVKKAGFIIGAKYGRGFVVCRKDASARWGAPAAITRGRGKLRLSDRSLRDGRSHARHGSTQHGRNSLQ